MIVVTIDEGTANVEQPIKAVGTAGRQVAITHENVPFAALQLIRSPQIEREFGAQKGWHAIGPEFFDPLPGEELNAWEG